VPTRSPACRRVNGRSRRLADRRLGA
jgi:hypothetical protein